MAIFRPIQNSFTAGELSPRLEARDDLKQYAKGARRLQNAIVLPHGGVIHRSGTHFVKEVKDSSKLTILYPFQVSVEQAYVVEIGDLYFRFFTNEGRVESPPGTPVEVVSPYPSTALRDLNFVQQADVVYCAHPNFPTYKLSRTSLTTFTLTRVSWIDGKAPLQALNSTATTITVTGTGPYTLTASAAIFNTDPTFDVNRAVRVKNGANEAWFKITSVTSTTVATATLQSGTAPTGATVDWQLGMESDKEGFRSMVFHEGRLVLGGSGTLGENANRIAMSDSDNFEKFSNDATLADNAVYRHVTSGQVNAIQWLASLNDMLRVGTAGGEFKVVGANDDLLTPAGAKVRPLTKRGSVHLPAVAVGESLHFIQRNGRKLRQAAFDVTRELNTARDVSIVSEHILRNGGAVELAYQQDPDSIVWILRGDGVLVGFTIEVDQEVVAAHAHVFGGSFQGEVAFCESIAVIPDPLGTEDQLWTIVKRTINGVTKRYVEFVEEQFNPTLTPASTQNERINALKGAWFLDSAVSLGNTNVIAIAGITQANPGVVTLDTTLLTNGDQVYIDGILGMEELNDIAFIVRNKTGTTVTLETLAGAAVDTTAFGAYIAGGEARLMVNVLSNLGHLEGEVVGILADGGTHPDKIVTGGSITLDRLAARVVVGKKRFSYGETQRFYPETGAGSSQGDRARISRVKMRLHNTLGLTLGTGPIPDFLEPATLREGAFVMDRPPPLFSGDVDISVESEWGTEPTVYWEQTEPLPYTILAIMPKVETNAG